MTSYGVEIESIGTHHQVIIDGQDLSDFIGQANLRIDPRSLNELDIELTPAVLKYKGDSKIELELAPEVKEFLIKMGWTPPRETES